MTKILLAGGGTAGHVNPLLATARRLEDQGFECLVLGSREGLEVRLVPEAGFNLISMPRLPFPRKISAAAVMFPFRFGSQVREVFRTIRQSSVAAVVGFGGYVAAPAYVAAWLARIPLVIHEANALPGFANKLGARLTRNVAVTFKETKLAHAVQTGLPLRQAIEDSIGRLDKVQMRIEIGLEPFQPTLLVMGGSLGARSINDTMLAARPLLEAAGIQVFHILGDRSELPEVSERGYLAVRYASNMQAVIAAADFAVARAGAATVCEFAAAGLPALFVPYPVGNGEQAWNTSGLLRAGGALQVRDSEFTIETIRSLVIPTVSNPKKLQTMAAASKAEGIVDGTSRLVAMIRRALDRVVKP